MRIDTKEDMHTHLLGNPDLFILKIGKVLRNQYNFIEERDEIKRPF